MALNGYSNQEQFQLIAELLQGLDLAQQLQAQMGPRQAEKMLLNGILASFSNSLSLLKWGGSMEQLHHHVVPCTNIPESSISAIGSPKSEDLNPTQQHTKDFSKKRKMTSSWTKQEKVRSENGADGPPDDGYSWRKYGQKDILGAKHPRSYYRCTYRNMQSCCAIKQVQRSDEDFFVFDITYKGRHTCILPSRSKSPSTSPQKRGPKKQPEFPTMDYYPQQQPNLLLNFQTELNIDTQNLENHELEFPYLGRESEYDNHPFLQSTHIDNSFYSNFSPSFVLSPATPESTYFSTSPCKMGTFGGAHSGQNTESDITDLISATTSRANSPIISTDFPLDQLEFNPGFLYDSQTFFPSFSQAKE